MPGTRDSSLWRSIAIAFGDGLAFGVGMKLTQNAGRQQLALTPAAPPQDLSPVAERLAQLEARVETVERSPVAHAAGSTLDQRVLQAVVNAIEARLQETTSGVERRLAEMQANFALELKSLDSRITGVASAAQTGLGELKTGFAGVLQASEQRSADRVASMDQKIADLRSEIQTAVPEAIRQGVEARVAGFESKIQQEINSAAARAAEMARHAVESRFEQEFLPVRITAERQREKIEELRRRSEQSDRTVLELLSGIGRLCDEAARKIRPEAPQDLSANPQPAALHGVAEASALLASAVPVALNTAEPAAVSAAALPTALQSPAASVEPAAPEPEDGEALPGVPLEPMLEQAAEADLPGFARAKAPGRVWRIPLVSSFLAGGLALAVLRYV